jgi:endonuclease I
MRRLVLLFGLLAMVAMAVGQPPANYYNSAEGLTGDQLKSALHNIIKGHTSISYAQIWNAFWSTDNKGNGIVWDMYSDRPSGTPPYTYQLGMDQCGNYNGEGDCYNREHSWPQSWFNEQTTPRTDMHHIFATDGFVNGKRGNYPFGEVQSASWTSQNGSKLGSSKTPGYSGTVFEPIDAYKGDFARALMYMSVRYYTEDASWGSSDMTTKSVIKPWAIAMLLRWNELDPVSQKEIDRNNAIYNDYQHNRNPFVDHPEYARMIWDPHWGMDDHFEEQNVAKADHVVVFDLMGRKLLQTDLKEGDDYNMLLSEKLNHGCYLLQFFSGSRVIMNRKLLVN